MMYTHNKLDAGVRRFLTSSVYAIDCDGRIYTLACAGPKDEYKFKPIAGACKDPAPYAGKYKTQEAAIDAALKDDYMVYEFGNENEFYAWLGERYAAPVLGVAPCPTDTERISILENEVSKLRNFWSLRFSDLLKKVEKSKDTQPSEIRLELNRADGFYVVSYPGTQELFVVRSKDNVWYFLPPGKEVKYSGYLTIHHKLDMYA